MNRPTPLRAMPALNLIAEPGRRRAALDLAREIERRGFAMIQVSSSYANMAQCTGLALATERIEFATAIAPIYAQTAEEFAHGAAYIHEVSGGRFQFGIGVAHGPSYVRMGVTPGKPLGDIRAFVAKYRAYENVGGLPPIVLATLRRRMIALAGEIADGMVFANGSRSHMAEFAGRSSARKARGPGVFYRQPHPHLHQRRSRRGQSGAAPGDDALRAAAVLPQLLEGGGLSRGDGGGRARRRRGSRGGYPALSDRPLLADVTLSGTAAQVRDGVEAWREAGIRTPVLVPLSADGDQVTALREIFAAFA